MIAQSRPSPYSYLSWVVLPPCTLVVVDPDGTQVLVRSIDEGYSVAQRLNLAGPRVLQMTTVDIQTGASATDNLYFRGNGRNGGMLHHGHVDGTPSLVTEFVSDRTLRRDTNLWRNGALAAFIEELLRGRAHNVRAVIFKGAVVKTIRTSGVSPNYAAHRVVLHLVSTTRGDTA